MAGELVAAGATLGPWGAAAGAVGELALASSGGGGGGPPVPTNAESGISGDVNAQFNPPNFPFNPDASGFTDLSTINPSTGILLAVAGILVLVLVVGRVKG